MADLMGKTAPDTGASRGIGQAIRRPARLSRRRVGRCG
jgi:hypothetical protein